MVHATEPSELTLLEASRIAGTSTEAIRNWCVDLGIGVQEDGRWRVDAGKLRKVVEARAVLGRGAAR